jgi:hypothetical protein
LPPITLERYSNWEDKKGSKKNAERNNCQITVKEILPNEHKESGILFVMKYATNRIAWIKSNATRYAILLNPIVEMRKRIEYCAICFEENEIISLSRNANNKGMNK